MDKLAVHDVSISNDATLIPPDYLNSNRLAHLTYRDSQDFSLSSFIRDFSKKLDANSSSSFLMHVDDKDTSKTMIAPPNPNVTDLDLATKLEVLRRMSGLDFRCSSHNFSTPSFPNSGCNMDRPYEDADSWDEFDKIMEKSLPAKDWELVEFEDRVRQFGISSLKAAEQFEFISADEAKREMDKEEEFRAQFLQPEDATFVSENNGLSLLIDPLSMTSYFQARSSFPIDNCANESTMLSERDPYESQNEKTLVGLDPSQVSKSNMLFTELSKLDGKESSQAEDGLSISATAVQKFLMTSMSDGARHDEITNYIIEACKASAEQHCASQKKVAPAENLNLPTSTSTPLLKPPTPRRRSTATTQQQPSNIPPKSGPKKISHTLAQTDKLHSKPESSTIIVSKGEKSDPAVRTTKVMFKVPEAKKVSIKPSIQKMEKSVIISSSYCRDSKSKSTQRFTATIPAVQTREIEKSIVISESGKATYFADHDNSIDFDSFKRNLNSHALETPQPATQVVQTNESTVRHNCLQQSNVNHGISIHIHLPPFPSGVYNPQHDFNQNPQHSRNQYPQHSRNTAQQSRNQYPPQQNIIPHLQNNTNQYPQLNINLVLPPFTQNPAPST